MGPSSGMPSPRVVTRDLHESRFPATRANSSRHRSRNASSLPPSALGPSASHQSGECLSQVYDARAINSAWLTGYALRANAINTAAAPSVNSSGTSDSDSSHLAARDLISSLIIITACSNSANACDLLCSQLILGRLLYPSTIKLRKRGRAASSPANSSICSLVSVISTLPRSSPTAKVTFQCPSSTRSRYVIHAGCFLNIGGPHSDPDIGWTGLLSISFCSAIQLCLSYSPSLHWPQSL